MFKRKGRTAIDIGALYESCRQPVLAFVRTLTRDDAFAEDITQQAFVKALAHRTALAAMPEAQRRGWLIVTARNAYFDASRKNKRLFFADEAGVDEPDLCDLTGVEVAQHLSRLPAPIRKAFELKCYGGLTSAEIGQYLGIAPSSARSRVAAAVELLKRDLTQD